MKALQSTQLRKSSPSLLLRLCKVGLSLILFLLVISGLAIGGLFLRLEQGPLDIGQTPQAVAQRLTKIMQPGWSVSLNSSALQLYQGSPALRIDDLVIKNPQGLAVVRAQHAAVAVGLFALLTGSIEPRAFEIDGANVRLLIHENGTLSMLPPDEKKDQQEEEQQHVREEEDVASKYKNTNDVRTPTSEFVRLAFEHIFGTTGPLQNLDYAKVSNVRLTIENSERRRKAYFSNVQASIAWAKPQERRFEASINGERGTWHLFGDLRNHGQSSYDADLFIDKAPIQDILLLSSLSSVPLTTSINVSGQFFLDMKEGALQSFKGELQGHSGLIQLHDKDASSIAVDDIKVQTTWSALENALILNDATFKGGGNFISIGGVVLFNLPDAFAQMQLQGKRVELAGLTDKDPLILLNDVRANIFIRDAIEIEQLIVKGETVDAEMKATLGKVNDPKGFKISVIARESDGRAALRIWPEIAASKVRKFLVKHVQGALVKSLSLELDFSGQDIEGAISGKGMASQAMNINVDVVDGTMLIHEGLPALKHINAAAHVDGVSTRIAANATVPGGTKEGLTLSNGSVVIANFWNPSEQAVIMFDIAGAGGAVGAFLLNPALKSVVDVNLNPSQLSGTAALKAHLSIPMRDTPDLEKLPIQIVGKLSEFTYRNIFSTFNFENGNLDVSYVNGDISIKGAGSVVGTPIWVDVNQGKNAKQSIVSVSIDDAVRKKLGFSVGNKLNGIVDLNILLPIGKNKDTVFELDMTKASVNQLLPGWAKTAGKSGKIQFSVKKNDEGSLSLNHIVANVGTLQIEGTAELTKDNILKKVDFPVFKLTPGDDMKLTLEQGNAATRIVVRGNTADVRGLIKVLSKDDETSLRSTQSNSDASFATIGDNLDLDVMLNIVTGFSNEALTNASMKAQLRGGVPRQLSFTARLGSALVSADSSLNNNGTLITIKSEDAGRLLRFLDIYSRAYAGTLYLNTLWARGGEQRGTAVVEKVIVRNESGLKKIIPTEPRTMMVFDSQGREQWQMVDTNEVLFTKMSADFNKKGGRLDVKDVVIWGGQIGFTLNGMIDFRKDIMDISGTYIPAYGLNNAIANVPVFGAILGGGSNEGLVGVNFRIGGSVTAPILSVSPLSAITPGIFRKIFGEIERGGGQPVQNRQQPQRRNR